MMVITILYNEINTYNLQNQEKKKIEITTDKKKDVTQREAIF